MNLAPTMYRDRQAALRWLCAVAAAALLAGCAAPAPAGKDHVTASDQTPDDRRARVRMELAAAYFTRGQMTTALDEVKLAIAANPKLGAAYNLRGLIYAAMGDDRLAEESFRHALQIDQDDTEAMHNFAWYLCQKKRYPEADVLFERTLNSPNYRDSVRTLLAQGVCDARAGRIDEAEQALSKAFELDPANPAAAFNLAELLYQRGEMARARFYVRRVNAVPEQANAQSLWLAARIEKRVGNDQGATEFGNQLRERFPKSREAAAYDRGQFDG